VELDKLEEAFEHIEKQRLEFPKAGMVCLALVSTDLEDGSSEDIFLRARIEQIEENQVNVWLQLDSLIFLSGAVCITTS